MLSLRLPVRLTSRRAGCTALAAVVVVAALCLLAGRHPQTASAQRTITGMPRAVATVAAAPASVPACAPVDFGSPAQPNLAAAAAGLHVQADAPAQYHVYGNTAADLRTQIQRCGPGAGSSASPGAEFTGQTDYALNWQYNMAPTSTGCVLTGIKVGLHISTILPSWQPGSGAVPGLSSRWQAFMTGLTVHEQGHAAIDKAYAAKLAGDLSALSSPSCATLADRADSVANANAAALNQANDVYDTATNHGATQGAILPGY